MKDNHAQGERGMQLFALGLVVVTIGAILYLWMPQPGSWAIIVGGFAISVGMLMRSVQMRTADARTRRLDRMALLGALGYIVAGGMGLDGGNNWKVVFTIATVFVCYSIFVRKEKDK